MNNMTNDAVAMTPKKMGTEALLVGENLISAKQISFLKRHNLRVGAVLSVHVEDPRNSADTTWSNIARTFKEIDPNLKNKDINDYYYRGVVNQGHNIYVLVDIDTAIDLNANGFIMINKDQLKKQYEGVIQEQNLTENEIEKFLTAKANEKFRLDLDRYTCWVYGNIYDVTVFADNDVGTRISKTIKNCYNIENLIELEVSDAINSVADGIDNIDGALKITVQMDTNKVDGDYIGYIVDSIHREFDFAFTLGSTQENYNTGEVSLVLLPYEIPPFQDLINSSGFHLIHLMQKHTMDANGNESYGAWETVNMLTNLSFDEWGEIMQNALINTLFDSLHYVKLTNIEPISKPKATF